MKKIEILAPAGSMESLKASINAGADAVYMGGALFGARAYADNPEEDNLLRAIDYVHVRGKLLYLTVNTLLKDEELYGKLYDYLKPYYQEGLDAVIVQDVGVMRFIHEHFPKLPIHASTQMTLTMAEGAKVFEGMGVNRMVTSRELSIGEIRRIRANTSLEIESFVHGALCYSYSGQCLMSSMIGGRSGNRGRCAQPCRMEYDCKENGHALSSKEESYLLSPKDMCTLDSVAEFIEAGIDSFKIEGRMKRYEYAAGVVEAYRKQVDLYYELGSEGYRNYKEKHPEMMKEEIRRLQDLYNRGGFHDGYYHAHNGKKMMSMHRPNHTGVFAGSVIGVQGISASIRLNEDVNAQDVLEICAFGDKIYEFTVKDGAKKGTIIKTNFKSGSKVVTGNEVFRTKNNHLLEELSEKYYEKERKVEISGTLKAVIDRELELRIQKRISDTKTIEVIEYGDIVTAALKQPVTKEKMEEQLRKTNETPFLFSELTVDVQGEVFVPVSKLNELRRNALERMEQAIVENYKRTDEASNQRAEFEQESSPEREKPLFISYVKNEEQLRAACQIEEVDEIFLDMAENDFTEITSLAGLTNDCGKRFYLVMPHIFRSMTWDLFLKHKEELLDESVSGYVIKNQEEFYFFETLRKETGRSFELRLDYNMYVMNQEARKFYKERGIRRMTAPYELNQEELRKLGIQDMDLVVYGYLPLMISAQCVKNNTSGCKKLQKNKIEEQDRKQENEEQVVLIDRMKNQLMVRTDCRECYNTIYNSKCLSLLNEEKDIDRLKPFGIRLDFTSEDAKEVKSILRAYAEVFIHGRNAELSSKDFTKGHFRRGIM